MPTLSGLENSGYHHLEARGKMSAGRGDKNKFLEQLTHGTQYGIRDMESLQIGHVWKAKLVLETIKSVDVRRWDNEVLAALR